MTDPVQAQATIKNPQALEASFGRGAIVSTLSVAAAAAWGATRTRRVNRDNWKTTLEGFDVLSTDDIYKEVEGNFTEHLGQTIVAEYLVLIRQDDAVAQLVTFEVVGTDDGPYILTINGVEFQHDAVAQTEAQIRDALVALVEGGDEPVTGAAGGGNTGTLTADVAGESFTFAQSSPNGDANITLVVTTPNTGPAEALDDALQDDADGDDTWFHLMCAQHSDGLTREIARWSATATHRHVFHAESNTATVKDASTGHVGEWLKVKQYRRTALTYHTADQQVVARWVGRCGAHDVGTINWSSRRLTGPTPIKYKLDGGDANLEVNNVNRFDAAGPNGAGWMLYGTTATGAFIDQVMLEDVAEVRGEFRLKVLLDEEDIVPYTEQGALQGKAAILEMAGELERQGALVAGSSEVLVGSFADIPDDDKAVRNFPLYTLKAKARGAMNRVIPLTIEIAA